MSIHKRAVLLSIIAIAVAPILLIAPKPQAAAVPRGADGLIFFTAYGDDGAHIWRMRVDGTGAQQISNSIGEDHFPEVSPDGRSIVFQASRAGGGIYTMRTDGSNVKRLTDNTSVPWSDAVASWSPDGRRIIFTRFAGGHPHIYVMNANGSNSPHQLAHHAAGIEPTFTPDGLRIVFVRFVEGTQNSDAELFIMDANGSHQHRLTTNGLDDKTPVVSPDGKRILFARGSDDNYDVFTMNTDGTHTIQLTHEPGYDWYATWSPDGRRILYARESGDSGTLWVMNADGTGAHALLGSGSAAISPTWGTTPSTCLNHWVTIRGTAGRDISRGTPGRDVIAGRGGNDVLKGFGGNDVLCGGPGADVLVGGKGADKLSGGSGRDRLAAGR